MQRNHGKGTSATNPNIPNTNAAQQQTQDDMEVDQIAEFPNPPHPIVEREFTAEDMSKLSVNEHLRYLTNSKKIGHVFLTTDEAGNTVGFQYAIPEGETIETTDGNKHTPPEVRELHDIKELVTNDGLTRYRAKTPDGTEMFATRLYHGEFGIGDDAQPFTFAPMSPKPENKYKLPFFGKNESEIKIFKTDAELKKGKLKDHKAELAEIEAKGKVTKCGSVLQVDHASVAIRETNPKRNPDQNTVMGQSAKEAYDDFLDMWKDVLSKEFIERLNRATSADIKNTFFSNYRPEWLHGEGHSLTPITKNPQVAENLGSAPKWANTHMMVLERVVKWFALHRPNSFLTLKTDFEMLLDSELIKHIDFQVTIEEKNRYIKLVKSLDTFIQYPMFPKASDLMQLTAGAYSMIEGVKPMKEDVVKKGTIRKQQASNKPNVLLTAIHSTEAQSQQKPVIATTSTADVQRAPQPAPIIAPQPRRAVPAALQLHDVQAFPTQYEFERSLVQTIKTGAAYSYEQPFNAPGTFRSGGTGFIVEHNNIKYVVTNAHCVENCKYMTVRFANQKEKYKAKVKMRMYQCDLALMEVVGKNKQSFQDYAVAVQLGDMVSLKQTVETVGFPMGGEEISISRGIVSRIEVRGYCMSDQDMLQVQIDAAINPGNSGGPVFSDGKVVGAAFQGYDRQGLGFMIPIVIVKHFLKGAFSGKEYKGFPILPVDFQTLENPMLKRFYQMTPEQTGVRIKNIDELSDAKNKLKKGDIVLALDGHKINDNGGVDIPEVGNNIDMVHLTHMKQIGDIIRVKVLRIDEATKKPGIIDIDVVLDRVPLETQKIAATEYDKMPTCYVNGGIQFQPLTRNLIEEKLSDLAEYHILGEGDLLSVSKKQPNQQFVVISDIYNCKELEGYGGAEGQIVKRINGIEINNILDVIEAMEGDFKDEQYKDVHVIETANNDHFIIKRSSREKTLKLLNKYNIKTDRSDDLPPPKVNVVAQAVAPLKDDMESESDSADSMDDDLEDDAINDDDKHAEKVLSGVGMLPGQRKWLADIDRIAGKYSAMQQLDDDADDDEYHSFTAGGSDMDDDAEDDLSEDEDSKERKSSSHATQNRNRFFAQAKPTNDSKHAEENKKKRKSNRVIEEDDDEVNESKSKRSKK